MSIVAKKKEITTTHTMNQKSSVAHRTLNHHLNFSLTWWLPQIGCFFFFLFTSVFAWFCRCLLCIERCVVDFFFSRIVFASSHSPDVIAFNFYKDTHQEVARWYRKSCNERVVNANAMKKKRTRKKNFMRKKRRQHTIEWISNVHKTDNDKLNNNF